MALNLPPYPHRPGAPHIDGHVPGDPIASFTMLAAIFLQEFVGSIPWAHLDIAGPAFLDKDKPYTRKGGTGFGVRTLLRWLVDAAVDRS